MNPALALRSARLNQMTGYYEIIEAAAEYEVPEELIHDLGKFLEETNGLIAYWYADLEEDKKATVIVRNPFKL